MEAAPAEGAPLGVLFGGKEARGKGRIAGRAYVDMARTGQGEQQNEQQRRSTRAEQRQQMDAAGRGGCA
jgi:hypothetical protein